MTPLKYDLLWRCNAPEAEGYVLYGDNGLAFDLAGCTLRMQARIESGAPGSAIIDLGMAAEGEPGFSLDDAANGEFTLTPPTATTLETLFDTLSSGFDDDCRQVILSYDVLLISADGKPEPFFFGSLHLLPGVTRL